MAGSETPLVIRVAANLTELRANLAEGVNQIETTSSAMKRMATAYDRVANHFAGGGGDGGDSVGRRGD
jgi:hypothetical protein